MKRVEHMITDFSFTTISFFSGEDLMLSSIDHTCPIISYRDDRSVKRNMRDWDVVKETMEIEIEIIM
jgi:hypothetical protein